MTAVNLDSDTQWILSSSADRWLVEATAALEQGDSELPLLRRLRKTLPTTQARLVVQQAVLRRRARKKFSLANEMFFTPQGLEQATSEPIARLKAERFDTDRPIADLCCGIGGDAVGFARRRSQLSLLDQDPESVAFAARNVAQVTPQEVATICDDAANWQSQMAATLRFGNLQRYQVHLDPARRNDRLKNDGRRAVRMEHFQPSREFIEQLMQQHDCCVKLAPATPVSPTVAESTERHWIGHQGESKQQLLWSGSLAHHPGGKTVSVLDASGRAESISFGPCDGASEALKRAVGMAAAEVPVGAFLLYPHSVVRVSRTTPLLARHLGVAWLDTNPTCLIHSKPIQSALVACFEVMAISSSRPKRLRDDLKSLKAGAVEFKGAASHLAGAMKLRDFEGEQSMTVFGLKTGNSVTIFLCRRVGETVSV